MANLISPNEINFTAFEPKTQNRFIMYIDGIPSFIVKKAQRPTYTSADITLDHINVKRKLKGKSDWNDITLELYDPIVPSGAQSTMEWIRMSHESVTGRDGYADFYKKDITINVLGPVGDKVEEWIIKGAYIKESNFGELDWASESDVVMISLTIRYDYAILNY